MNKTKLTFNKSDFAQLRQSKAESVFETKPPKAEFKKPIGHHLLEGSHLPRIASHNELSSKSSLRKEEKDSRRRHSDLSWVTDKQLKLVLEVGGAVEGQPVHSELKFRTGLFKKKDLNFSKSKTFVHNPTESEARTADPADNGNKGRQGELARTRLRFLAERQKGSLGQEEGEPRPLDSCKLLSAVGRKTRTRLLHKHCDPGEELLNSSSSEHSNLSGIVFDQNALKSEEPAEPHAFNLKELLDESEEGPVEANRQGEVGGEEAGECRPGKKEVKGEEGGWPKARRSRQGQSDSCEEDSESVELRKDGLAKGDNYLDNDMEFIVTSDMEISGIRTDEARSVDGELGQGKNRGNEVTCSEGQQDGVTQLQGKGSAGCSRDGEDLEKSEGPLREVESVTKESHKLQAVQVSGWQETVLQTREGQSGEVVEQHLTREPEQERAGDIDWSDGPKNAEAKDNVGGQPQHELPLNEALPKTTLAIPALSLPDPVPIAVLSPTAEPPFHPLCYSIVPGQQLKPLSLSLPLFSNNQPNALPKDEPLPVQQVKPAESPQFANQRQRLSKGKHIQDHLQLRPATQVQHLPAFQNLRQTKPRIPAGQADNSKPKGDTPGPEFLQRAGLV